MKRYYRFIALFFLTFFSFFIKGQVSFDAILEPEEVSVNDVFSVTFQLELRNAKHELGAIDYPDFSNFDLIGRSNSEQHNLTNTTIFKTLTFKALKEGVFEIGSARVIIDGKLYKTEPLKIKVIGNASNPKKNPANLKKIPQEGSVLTNETSENTKLLVTASNLSPYVGEQVFISLRILSKDYNVLRRIKESKLNRFKNFTAIDYPIKRVVIKQENYQDSMYYSRVINQKIITPQQTGQLVLEPFQLEFPYLVETNQRDFFGRLFNQYIWVKLDSNELTFNVKPLPKKGKPKNFNGAVGDFNLNVFVDKNRVNAGAPVQFDVEISGKGDFKMVTVPQLSLPDELELYEPNSYESITLTREGHKGKVSKNYAIVPQYKGDYELPVLKFSFFNPKKRKYETKTSSKITLHVVNGPEKPATEVLTNETDSIAQEKTIQEELFLQPLKKSLAFHDPFLSAQQIWILIVGSFAFMFLLIGLLPYWKKWKKGFKQKGHHKGQSKKYLIHAKKHLKRNEASSFYNAIEKALFWFLSDQLNIEKADYSTEKIKLLLQEKNIANEKINQVEEIVDACNYQKYSSSEAVYSMETIYQKTTDFINTFKK